MTTPFGPHRIGKSRQLALPAELLRQAKIETGDAVYVALADDPPGALLVIPVETVVTWIQKGKRAPARDPDAELRRGT